MTMNEHEIRPNRYTRMRKEITDDMWDPVSYTLDFYQDDELVGSKTYPGQNIHFVDNISEQWITGKLDEREIS